LQFGTHAWPLGWVDGHQRIDWAGAGFETVTAFPERSLVFVDGTQCDGMLVEKRVDPPTQACVVHQVDGTV
jgi:hypothetical protein